VAGLTAPPDNAEQQAGEMIAADGWFPAINTATISAKVRIGDGAVTPARLREAAIAGILAAIDMLKTWKAGHVEAGKTALAQVTADEIASENLAVLLWGRAVIFYAAAELVDGHADIAATDDALDREDEKRTTADLYRRKAYEAVADLLAIGAADGVTTGRNRVELL